MLLNYKTLNNFHALRKLKAPFFEVPFVEMYYTVLFFSNVYPQFHKHEIIDDQLIDIYWSEITKIFQTRVAQGLGNLGLGPRPQ
jgi:hypothetical protein